MSVAGVVVVVPPAGRSRRGGGPSPSPPRGGAGQPRSGRPRRASRPAAAGAAAAALAAGLDEIVVVVPDEQDAAGLPGDATVLLDEADEPSPASGVLAALDWCGRSGYGAVVVAVVPAQGEATAAALDAGLWGRLARTGSGPVVLAAGGRGEVSRGRPGAGAGEGPVRLDAAVWSLVPLSGELSAMWRARPELVAELPAPPAHAEPPAGAEPPVPGPEPTTTTDAAEPVPSAAAEAVPSPADVAAVTELLGRPPAGGFRVVVRDRAGAPVVIENAPLLEDGTPMPTRWWLVGRPAREAVSRLESAGGVAAAQSEVPPEEVAAAHDRYAAAREAAMPDGHSGPRPSGGVGGTRYGVKCLHAHLAAYLAGTGDPVGRWTAARLAGQLEGNVAAIDCGTNSTRLLVAAPDGTPIERRMRITKLGEGVDEDRRLGVAAIERTITVLAEYREVMDAHGVVAVRAAATSAARDSANAGDLLYRARQVLGVPLEVLSGVEEGTLSYRGATAGLDPASGPFLVLDLGGGSAELIAPASGGEGLAAVSLPAGCVRMTERYLRQDPPPPAELLEARRASSELARQALASEPALAAPARVVGVAGTVTSLAALALGLESYDPACTHHSVLRVEQIESLLASLAAQPLGERRRRSPLEPARAETIVGGTCVLLGVLEALSAESLLVSETDSLDGLVASLLTP